MKNLEKRSRVMRRSMQLGHCICEPKKTCPCDTLREQDLCPCAGERADVWTGTVRLTQLVESPGCASKIDQATLRQVLHGLPFFDDPRVLVGAPAGDDAGVFRLDAETALVQTVDVFSPSVDDPYTFGQIAAANSLSDVYAMGGRPLTALSIVGFPAATLPHHILHDILRGGIDKMAEAGVSVLGGHSIKDGEIKAGFAVTGLVHPDRILTNAEARPGDRLILTKPLGTGILGFAAQIGRAPAGAMEAAARCDGTIEPAGCRTHGRDAARTCHRCDRLWTGRPPGGDGRSLEDGRRSDLGRASAAAGRARMCGPRTSFLAAWNVIANLRPRRSRPMTGCRRRRWISASIRRPPAGC